MSGLTSSRSSAAPPRRRFLARLLTVGVAVGMAGAGAIAAPPAVINAITDALGHEDIAMPATPQAVWRAAQKAQMPMAAE
jgi:hypothetical protein